MIVWMHDHFNNMYMHLTQIKVHFDVKTMKN